jgi:hypothetical protein
LNGFALARSITTKINKRHRKNPQSQNFVVNHPTKSLKLNTNRKRMIALPIQQWLQKKR